MRRAYGHIQDPAEMIAPPLELLVGSAASSHVTANLMPHVPRVLDQADTFACVGFAFAQAVAIRASVAGVPLPEVSPLAIYTLARQLANPAAPLFDGGCAPYRAIEAMQEWGLVAESRWPMVPENIGREVPLDVLQHGAEGMLLGYAKIGQADQNRGVRIRQALSQGYPVAFAMEVDAYYEAGPMGVFRALREQPIGSHMQVIVGFGGPAFLVVNSWGPAWNEGGTAWVGEEWIESPHCSDFYAVIAAPTAVS